MKRSKGNRPGAWKAPALILLLAAFSGCSKREAGVLRLIDRLGKEEVLSSPLAGLDAVFVPVGQKNRPGDFRKFIVDSRPWWGVATRFPLAHQYQSDKLADVQVLRDGEPLEFSPEPLKDRYAWKWIKGERKIRLGELMEDTGGPINRYYDLEAGKSLRVRALLPPGAAVFDLRARSGEPDVYGVVLEIEIPGRGRREVSFVSLETRSWAEEIGPEETEVIITCRNSFPSGTAKRKKDRASVLLESLKVRPSADLILISPPAGSAQPDGDFDFWYVPEPVDHVIPVGRSVGPGAPLRQHFDFPSTGGRALDVFLGAKGKGGRLTITLGTRKLGSFSIPPSGLLSVPLAASEGKETGELKINLEPGKTGNIPSPAEVTVEFIRISNPLREIDLPFYYLRGFEIPDEGIGENPFGIKKKLEVGGCWRNVLFAPPPSAFEFEVKVPEKAVLKLGYGLLPEAWENKGDGVSFAVDVEQGGEKIELFASHLDPRRRPEEKAGVFKFIDLSAFENKKAKILLRTFAGRKNDPAGPDGPAADSAPACWINPVIISRSEAGKRESEAVNVVLVSLDTLRADHLGCYGYDKPTSPFLDQWVRDCTVFQNAVTTAPYTLSAHMSLMTGLLPTHHRVRYVDESLDPSVRTLADAFRTAGFQTAAVTGGATVGAGYGFAKGFDSFSEVEGANKLADSAGQVFASAARWLEENGENKFFLFLHTFQIHNPYNSPSPQGRLFLKENHPWKFAYLQSILQPGYPALFRKLTPLQTENLVALYDGEIRYTDEALLGPLIAELKRLNLYERTMIVVTSDHGEEFYDHYCWEHTHTVYQELIHVPLIIKWPGSRYQGRRVDPFVGTTDIMPTILEAAGLSYSGEGLDGASLTGLADGKEEKARTRMSYLPAGVAENIPRRVAVLRSPYKLIANEDFGRGAYVYFSPPPPAVKPIELFHLLGDPGEKRNLAGRERNIVRDLLKTVSEFLGEEEDRLEGGKIVVDKAVEEKLRALGYIK